MEDFDNAKTDFDDEDDSPEKTHSNVQKMFQRGGDPQRIDFYRSQDESGTINTVSSVSLLDVTTTGGNQTLEQNFDTTVDQMRLRQNMMAPIIEENSFVEKDSQPSGLPRNASNRSMVSNSKSKNDQTLDEILAQNDEQMDKSHRTSKSKSNQDGSFVQQQNDISGLKMNTSLDRSQIAYQQMIMNNNSISGIYHPAMLTPLNLSLQQANLWPIQRSKSVQPIEKPPLFEQPPNSELDFLKVLKQQVQYLQKRLKQEIISKLKLIKQNDHLKKTLIAKDQLIMSLNQNITIDRIKFQQVLDQAKQQSQSFISQSKSAHEKQQNKLAELSARQMIQEPKSFKDLMVPEEKHSKDNSVLSNDNYVSPDDGLPNKRLSIFDTSRDDQVDQTSHMEPNSLYYLEHENSQVKGFNKPLQQKFKGNHNFERSGLGGLNASNTFLGQSVLRDNSMLNITNLNMSKNTMLRGLQDKSYLKRYQDPPSQSRIIQFDDIMSGMDSSIQKDEEVSRILFDKFNKSINKSYISSMKGGIKSARGGGNKAADRSVFIYDRTALGLPSQDDSFQGTEMSKINDQSMLRGLNLHNDQEVSICQDPDLLKDVSRVNELTQLQRDSSDLNTTNLQDVTGLNDVSHLQDESMLIDKSNEIEKIKLIQQNQQHQYDNLRDQSLQVILEESQAENETTQDDINLSALKSQRQPPADNGSPRSSQVNKLIGFFDKSQIDQSRAIDPGMTVQHDMSLLRDQEEAEQRFIENRKSLLNDSMTRSFKVPHKKPSQDQMKRLLANRKAQKSEMQNLSLDDKSFQRIKDRSMTYREPPKSQRGEKESGKRRSNTIQSIKQDHHLWKSKVDQLLAEKKNWMQERKELRQQLRSLELQNDELLLRVKKVRQLMVEEEEALLGFKQMQQQYGEISQIGAAVNASMLGPYPMNQSYLQNPNDQLGITAALDLDPVVLNNNQMNVTGFTNLLNMNNQFNMDNGSLNQNQKGDDTIIESEKPKNISEVRKALAQNIKEIEIQNEMAHQQLINQTSFLLSTHGNNMYENSINLNLTKDFQANDISAIPNLLNAGMQSQNDISAFGYLVKKQHLDESNFNFEVGEDQPSGGGAYQMPQRNTLEEIQQQQALRKSKAVIVKGDNDDVQYQESPSVTYSKKLEQIVEVSKQAETTEKKSQNSAPKTQEPKAWSKSSGKSLQKTVLQQNKPTQGESGLPSRILEVNQRLMQNEEKINSLIEPQRRTADFNDLQALQQDEPQQEKGFSNLFSFFKNKMRSSINTEMQEAVEQYKPKMRGSSHGKRDSEREQAQRDSAKSQCQRSRNSDKSPFRNKPGKSDSPEKAVRQFLDEDTPLRNNQPQLNFNNLVLEKPRAKTNLDMFRGSIHDALPSEMKPQQIHFQQQNGPHQDLDKTFESFSDQKQQRPVDKFLDGPGFGIKTASPGAVKTHQHESALKGSNSNSSVLSSSNKDDSKQTIRSNKFVSKVQRKGQEEAKRITFDPNDFNQLQSKQPFKQNLDQSSLGFPEKSRDEVSIDFNLIAGGGHQLLSPAQEDISGVLDHSALRGSGDQSKIHNRDSFISNIQRDKDASYIMLNQTGDLSLIQNSQYANASFLAGGLNTSQFNKSRVMGGQNKFFQDVKPKNQGISKIEAPEQESQRFTLGQDTSVQYTEEELQEIQMQQQYLQEQQLRQRVLQQQLLHQQALIQQQQMEHQLSYQTAAFPMSSGIGASALGSYNLLSQESIHGYQDSYLQNAIIQQNMLRQQQMLRQNTLAQYRESFGPGQLDKGQIRNLFLQMVGRSNEQTPVQSPQKMQQLIAQQQQQQMVQQQQEQQRNSKQFFDNLKSKKKQQLQNS